MTKRIEVIRADSDREEAVDLIDQAITSISSFQEWAHLENLNMNELDDALKLLKNAKAYLTKVHILETATKAKP